MHPETETRNHNHFSAFSWSINSVLIACYQPERKKLTVPKRTGYAATWVIILFRHYTCRRINELCHYKRGAFTNAQPIIRTITRDRSRFPRRVSGPREMCA